MRVVGVRTGDREQGTGRLQQKSRENVLEELTAGLSFKIDGN